MSAPRIAILVLAVTNVLWAAPTQAVAPLEDTPSVQRVGDRVGDVRKVKAEGPHYRGAVRTPHQRHGDLTAFRVRHRAQAVMLRVTVAKLRPDSHFREATFAIRTEEDTFFAYLMASQSAPGGKHLLAVSGAGALACPGLRHRFDYGRDLISARIPRSCLGRPDWVRAGATMVREVGGSGRYDLFIDVAPGRRLEDGPLLPRAWRPNL